MNEQLISQAEKEYQFKLKDYTNLKKAWILDTDRGPYFFKSFVFQDELRLKFIDGAMHHLIKHDFNHIIPFQQTRNGRPSFNYDGEVYFVAPYLNVRQSDYDNPVELAEAARLLAALHLSSHNYRPSLKWNPQYFWGRWPRRLKEKIQHLYTFRSALSKKTERDEFDQLFIEYFPYYFQQAQEALEKLLKSDYLSLMSHEQRFSTFCHHDYEYHNLLISPQNHYYVIDFDYLLCDTHLHDLTSLLIRAGKRANWEETRRELILHAYHSIYPLRTAEIPVIKAMLLFPQPFWQVAYARYFEAQPWPLHRFTQEITKKVSQESARLRYLNNLHYPE